MTQSNFKNSSKCFKNISWNELKDQIECDTMLESSDHRDFLVPGPLGPDFMAPGYEAKNLMSTPHKRPVSLDNHFLIRRHVS